MVTCFPYIKYFDGVCLGFSLAKHHAYKFEKEKACRASSILDISPQWHNMPIPTPIHEKGKVCTELNWQLVNIPMGLLTQDEL